jgi:uncharacterized paraquat-inducible protein A
MAERVMSLPAEIGSGPSPAVPPALAEIAAGTPCGRCGTSIQGRYFVANGHVVCERCRTTLQGSTGAAVRLGVAAAVLAAGAYYLVYAVWHLNFVLIAVIAGVLIGLAVRRGAQGNRAQRYRFLALGLTYVCVVSTYVPALLEMANVNNTLNNTAMAVLRSVYLPFLMLISMKNPVTLILLGFGLHESWKLSAPNVLNVDGPFHAVEAVNG